LFGKFTDKRIIEGIRLQDDKVLRYLYDNYYQMVKNHILRNSGLDQDVSDVFQDTVVTVYQQIKETDFTLTTDLKGYFFGIARNFWKEQLRNKRRVFDSDVDIAEEDEEDYLSDPALEKILNRSFMLLKPDSQTVLTLFYEGKSYEEIADLMYLKNETYARRKKYLSKEELMEIVKNDPEYQEHQRFRK
jgi:RNA polymerase sigma factor (sigma-70 family)